MTRAERSQAGVMLGRRGPRWRNHTGNQKCRPREICAPDSLDELRALVRRAEAEGTTVHPVGSGHAWSDVALTDGYLVKPGGMRGLQDLDDGTLRPELGGAPMVRVLGGTPLRELNDALDRRGLALPNMGGYDAQTIAGVVATSTHGSGLAWGPFPDLVRSVELVVSGGAVVRVEPADGPTDAAAFAARFGDDRRLVQDDATFAAARCGVGAMGIVYALVIDVREKFWLNEIRRLRTWDEVRGRLRADGVLGEGGHYELFVNPYADGDGRHRLVETWRRDCPAPDGLAGHLRERHPLTEMVSSFFLAWFVLRLLARFAPSLMARRFDQTLTDMADEGYANVSYRVFNIGEANHLPAYSMELGVGLDGDRHLEAVERIFGIAAARRKDRRWFHTCPIALRFVGPSEASISMMHDRPTMMIELIMVPGTRGGFDLLAEYERELADLDVRPHWGQFNVLTAQRAAELYPQWDAWRAVAQEFNASGVFDTAFSRRLGIAGGGEALRPARPPAAAGPAG
jgi:L-gulono-1,4-lactone dehydrogenase